ncbi:hypothetical protein [Carnobacterium divergens]|uniref:hypothetical protein n=1 Tax=Carnobacterium divergens TaxID=2748 RepID=UPI0007F5359B|nr:hypothetical protein [Carnobacterium divergens]SBO16475.1 hypothetical protein CDIV41_140196 [Carnobacterium divergens]
MNINLLPQKFIKNRAIDIIIFATSAAFLFFILLFVAFGIYFNVNLNRATVKLQQARVEKITFEKQVSELEEAQSLDIQNHLKTYKSQKQLVSPMMATFEKIANDLNLKILNYQVTAKENEEDSNQIEVSSTGESLLQPLTIRLSGDLYDNTPRFIDELEKIDWVYDVQPISMISESSKTISEFIIRVVKTENQNEEETNE